MTLEKLAIMVAQGFEQIQETMATKDELDLVKQGQAKLEQGQEALREELSEVKDGQASLKEDSKDTNRCVISIERKLSGTLESLDETVHRSEFNIVTTVFHKGQSFVNVKQEKTAFNGGFYF